MEGNLSQSLLNEVFFPTIDANMHGIRKSVWSQSLLNEVFFPTSNGGVTIYAEPLAVAIPSK